jgi:glycine hydroxymethyltransferase
MYMFIGLFLDWLADCSGAKMQSMCDECAITLNKNTVPGDTSALNPGGVRLGSSALTTRGFNVAHFHQVSICGC